MVPRRWAVAALLAISGCWLAGSAFADEAAINAKIERLEQKVETQDSEIQQLKARADGGATNPGAASDTTLGGYGEMTYNAYRRDTHRDQADLRRFVLFVGHRFDDQWSFNSEVEWEHAVASKDDQGETEIEQAYLNYQWSPAVSVRTGLFLMPFGFLNESHEPPVFYGVERNEVETRIIPSTWREGGVSLVGSAPFGLEANLGVTTGFDIAKFDDPSHPLSSVHQELQLAHARDLSYYGVLNYRGLPGFVLGGGVFSGKSSQGNADFNADPAQPDLSGIDARVTLGDVHTRWQKGGWDLEALYAEGCIGEAGEIDRRIDAFNTASGGTRAFVPKRFNGWLAQVAYTLWQRGDASLTPFVRYEGFDTQASMPDGFPADAANRDRVTTAGLSFKPLSQIVFKTDHQSFRDNPANDRFNVGVGYMF